MWEKPIWEISSEVLGFEIKAFSDINRVLNIIDQNISDDEKIHYLRILIKSMNENSVTFNTPKNQKKTMRRFINIFNLLAKRFGNSPEYKNWLLKIHNWLNKYLDTLESSTFQSWIRNDIERILRRTTQPRYNSWIDYVYGRRSR